MFEEVPVYAVKVGEILHHFIWCESVIETGVTREKSELPSHRLRLTDSIVPGDCYRSARRFEHGGNDAQRGRLAGAIWTQKCKDASWSACKADIVYRVDGIT